MVRDQYPTYAIFPTLLFCRYMLFLPFVLFWPSLPVSGLVSSWFSHLYFLFPVLFPLGFLTFTSCFRSCFLLVFSPLLPVSGLVSSWFSHLLFLFPVLFPPGFLTFTSCFRSCFLLVFSSSLPVSGLVSSWFSHLYFLFPVLFPPGLILLLFQFPILLLQLKGLPPKNKTVMGSLNFNPRIFRLSSGISVAADEAVLNKVCKKPSWFNNVHLYNVQRTYWKKNVRAAPNCPADHCLEH